MNKRLVELCGVVALAMTLVAGCGGTKQGDIGANDYNVDGKYQMEIASGDSASTVFAYHFSKEDMTFSETVTVGDTDCELLAGTYEIDESNDLVHTVSDKNVKQDFVIYGQYLIADGFFYEGEIPDGKKFNASCTYTNEAGSTSSIEFKKDGTFSFSGSMKCSGTYEREGQRILVHTDDGSSLVDFIIYNSKISNSYFKKCNTGE